MNERDLDEADSRRPEDSSSSEALDRLGDVRPDLAALVRRLGQDSSPAASASFARSRFARRLAERYGIAEPDPDPQPEASPLDAADLDAKWGSARYRVVGEIARGGMGIVLEVLDLDLDRILAMKIIQDQQTRASASATTATSLSLVQRFLREAKVTAQLDHPGVVPVFDVGVHRDGSVFFTMRRVEGEDLREVFAASRRGDPRWTRGAVVDVLLKVCDTIAFCHDRGVVHRDLKPANIRVGRYGEVYVMDWGLARLFGEADELDSDAGTMLGNGDGLETLDGQVLGTPAYMSPEQAAGKRSDIGPSCDVYSIGAMLYTLLAGTPPYLDNDRSKSSAEVLAALQAGPPLPLRSLGLDDPSTLIEICDRAMARSPSDRHPSVQALGDAIRNQRERERAALRDAEQAQRDAQRARRVSSFLINLFEATDPNEAHRGSITVDDLLERGAERLRTDFHDDVSVRATLERTLGIAHDKLGNSDRARRHLESALDLHESRSDADPLELAESCEALAHFHASHHAYARAEELYERGMVLRVAELGAEDLLVSETRQHLAIVQLHLGKIDEAERSIRSALSTRRAQLPPDSPDLGHTIHNLAFFLCHVGRIREAIEAFGTALDIWRRSLGDHLTTASCLHNMARALAEVGEVDAARHRAHEALEIRERLLGAIHPSVASTLQNLASIELDVGRHAESIRLLGRALRIREQLFPDDHPAILSTMNNLAVAHLTRGDAEEALALNRNVLERQERVLDPGHRSIATARHNLGVCLFKCGRIDEAIGPLRRAIEDRRRILAPEHHDLALSLTALANALSEAGDLDEPERLLDEADAIRRANFDETHLAHASTAEARGRLARKRGDLARARAHFDAAMAIRESAGHTLSWAEAAVAAGEVCFDAGRLDEARALLDRAEPILAECASERHGSRIAATRLRAQL
ncbi:MAG: serine/threonine protein kinase [Planctomycetes bacterium]|nr:serine/threonine protein kinase [Planctomycetota bacterium]